MKRQPRHSDLHRCILPPRSRASRALVKASVPLVAAATGSSYGGNGGLSSATKDGAIKPRPCRRCRCVALDALGESSADASASPRTARANGSSTIDRFAPLIPVAHAAQLLFRGNDGRAARGLSPHTAPRGDKSSERPPARCNSPAPSLGDPARVRAVALPARPRKRFFFFDSERKPANDSGALMAAPAFHMVVRNALERSGGYAESELPARASGLEDGGGTRGRRCMRRMLRWRRSVPKSRNVMQLQVLVGQAIARARTASRMLFPRLMAWHPLSLSLRISFASWPHPQEFWFGRGHLASALQRIYSGLRMTSSLSFGAKM